jgi:hypothetical protein
VTGADDRPDAVRERHHDDTPATAEEIEAGRRLRAQAQARLRARAAS